MKYEEWGNTPIPVEAFRDVLRFFEGVVVLVDDSKISGIEFEDDVVFTENDEKGLYERYVEYMKQEVEEV